MREGYKAPDRSMHTRHIVPEASPIHIRCIFKRWSNRQRKPRQLDVSNFGASTKEQTEHSHNAL